MDVLLILIPLSICITTLGLLALSWAIRAGQFHDLKRPAYQPIFEEGSYDAEEEGKDKHDTLRRLD